MCTVFCENLNSLLVYILYVFENLPTSILVILTNLGFLKKLKGDTKDLIKMRLTKKIVTF